MSGDFLLEIGCEEIPAWMAPRARASLKELLEHELLARGLLQGAPVETLGTPRRLVATCPRLAAAEPNRVIEVIGPPKGVSYDPAGKPTRAAESFAQKQGVRVGDLKVVQTPKGPYVAVVSRQKGRPTPAVLAEVLPAVIPKIEFPRTMAWAVAGGLRFIRPIRWLLALWCGRVVPFELAGLRAGRLTCGHRLLSPGPVRVKGVADYKRRLRQAKVLVDPDERRGRILEESKRLLARLRLRARPDAVLLELLVDSTEHPALVAGEFSRDFLSLPAEVLVTVMRHHQKYFSVENSRGEIAPRFLAVIDLDRDPQGTIRRNHEAVLGARFRDARFFWEADQKRPLTERLLLLENVVFESRLGSYRQKVARLEQFAVRLAAEVRADGRRADIETCKRAALLSKSDLTTEMVAEFPELQGVVGGLYARAQGEAEPLARALAEHYKPAGPEDTLPQTLEGAVLALADKLDTIAACFSVGLAPSGSRDPYGLRRAGTGVVRTIVEQRLRLSLSHAVHEALAILGGPGPAAAGPAAEPLLSFLEERARHLFREVKKLPYDEVNAAFAAGWDDLVDVAARLTALRRLRPTPDFEPVATAFKRIRNILEQAGQSDRTPQPIANSLIEAGPERDLYNRFLKLRPRVAELRERQNYEEALRQIASLRPHVDRYFDTVLVMAPDESLRRNRLSLLAHLLREFSTVADFSEIVVAPKGRQ